MAKHIAENIPTTGPIITSLLRLTSNPGVGKVMTSDIDGNITLQTPSSSGTGGLGGAINRDTVNNTFTYLGEVIAEKTASTTSVNYLITCDVSAGTGALRLYNFTNQTVIATISVLNTTKELKTGSILLTDLILGNNIIELQGKITGGQISVWSFQIKM